MEEGTFYGLTMKTPVIYAEIQVLLMHEHANDVREDTEGFSCELGKILQNNFLDARGLLCNDMSDSKDRSMAISDGTPSKIGGKGGR